MLKPLAGFALALLAVLACGSAAQAASSAQIARGKYLVTLGGCTDCHTPGSLIGHPDMSKFLGGSDVGFSIPGVGIFPGRNITPDKETGIGKWTVGQIVTAITKGVEPGGRQLAPVMPFRAFASLTKSDAQAIALYLKSIKPVRNEVPGPFGPTEKPTVLVFQVLPPNVYESLPKPPSAP